MATTSYDRKYSIDDLQTWLKGYDISYIKDADINGAQFSIQFNTGGRILVCIYPFTTDGCQLIDGRQANFDWLSSMSRFNQKRFDTIAYKWLPVAIHLCALYLIRGWKEPSWMNERLDDIAGLINGNSTYTPRMFCNDWFDRLRELDKANDQSKHEGAEAPTEAEQPANDEGAEAPTDDNPTIITHDEPTIVQRFRNSLRNGGRCLYNMSHGQSYHLPAIYQTAEVIDPIPEGQQFDGWEGYDLTMVVVRDLFDFNFVETAPTDITDVFSEELIEFASHHEDEFYLDERESVIIRAVNREMPTLFFEYIITDTLDRDAA